MGFFIFNVAIANYLQVRLPRFGRSVAFVLAISEVSLANPVSRTKAGGVLFSCKFVTMFKMLTWGS